MGFPKGGDGGGGGPPLGKNPQKIPNFFLSPYLSIILNQKTLLQEVLKKYEMLLMRKSKGNFPSILSPLQARVFRHF